MREQQVPVTEQTRRDIQDKIKNKQVDRYVFDVYFMILYRRNKTLEWVWEGVNLILQRKR